MAWRTATPCLRAADATVLRIKRQAGPSCSQRAPNLARYRLLAIFAPLVLCASWVLRCSPWQIACAPLGAAARVFSSYALTSRTSFEIVRLQAIAENTNDDGSWSESWTSRRDALSTAVSPLAILGTLSSAPVYAVDAQVYRTLKPVTRIPKVLAIMLLRTTYEAVQDWGCYNDMGEYQRDFVFKRRDSFQAFRDRYANYDLSDLFNTTKLMQTQDGGVTIRIYFSFLNEMQWRTISEKISRAPDRVRFSRVVGDRIYRRILTGFELRADVEGEAMPGVDASIGIWPMLTPPLPQGSQAGDIAAGANRLLAYLRDQGYCEGFDISEVEEKKDGVLRFKTFVLKPVNLEGTASMMRSNEDFAPRYDQRILQAFFGDRGFECTIVDRLAESIAEDPKSRQQVFGLPSGVVSSWVLTPDPDAGL